MVSKISVTSSQRSESIKLADKVCKLNQFIGCFFGSFVLRKSMPNNCLAPVSLMAILVLFAAVHCRQETGKERPLRIIVRPCCWFDKSLEAKVIGDL